jgi:2-iminobutanoate/2-iminopropanoate deaminase
VTPLERFGCNQIENFLERKCARMKKIVSTQSAPAAIGPYSQGVWSGELLFLSGQIPINPENGAMVEGDAAAQAEQVLKNIGAILASQGLTFRDVVKATVFSTDMGTFASVNEVYGRYFKEEPPARSFVEVSALPKGALVEIEVVASRS